MPFAGMGPRSEEKRRMEFTEENLQKIKNFLREEIFPAIDQFSENPLMNLVVASDLAVKIARAVVDPFRSILIIEECEAAAEL